MDRSVVLTAPVEPRTGFAAVNEIVVAPVRQEESCDIFPQGTADLLSGIGPRTKSANVTIRIASSDDRYVELAQHSIVLELGSLVLQWVLLPTATGILSAYIYDRFRRPADLEVRLSIHTERISIRYRGPADKLASTLDRVRSMIDGSPPQAPEAMTDVTHLLEDDLGETAP